MNSPEFLSNGSLATLRELLNKSIHTIYAPQIDIAGAHVAAWKPSVMVAKNDFINFSCNWTETPRYLNDSWSITVTRESDPIDIARNESGALIAPCSISMYHAKPIRKIEVFSYRHEDEDPNESVHYDQGILFHCEEERQFCIACLLNGPGIAEHLHFSEDRNVIREMLNETYSRLIFE